MHEHEMKGKLGAAFYDRHDDVALIPTLACNLGCEMCSYWCGEKYSKKIGETETKHLVQAIRELPRDIYLHIAGGEAATKQQRFWKIVRAASRLEKFSLITNGLPFLTEKGTEDMIEKFPKHGLVYVSLDPAHMRSWGEEQSETIMNNIAKFKAQGGRVAFGVTSRHAEQEEVKQLLARFSEQIGESPVNPTPTRFLGRGEKLAPSSLDRKTGSKQRSGGSYCFFIGPDGHLFKTEGDFVGFLRMVRGGNGPESAGKKHAIGRLGRESFSEIMARHLNVPRVKR